MRPARLDHTFFDNEPRSHLGALLLRKGLVTNEQLDQALEQKQQGEFLGEALVRLQFCFENDIARVLAEQAGVEFIDIGITSVDHRAVEPPALGAGAGRCGRSRSASIPTVTSRWPSPTPPTRPCCRRSSSRWDSPSGCS